MFLRVVLGLILELISRLHISTMPHKSDTVILNWKSLDVEVIIFSFLYSCTWSQNSSYADIFGKYSVKSNNNNKNGGWYNLSCTCCWHCGDLLSIRNYGPTGHKQHSNWFNKSLTFWIKDLSSWQIAMARGPLNLVIVLRSCWTVNYCRFSAAASVLGGF